MSHNIRTGAWKKANITPKAHFHFLMNSTNAQRSFIHEVCAQSLGRHPSNLWGVPVPRELIPRTDRHTLKHVMHAAKHSAHEFGRLISEHKKASGWISALGEAIAGGAKTVGKYAKSVGSFIGKNGAAIKTGIGITKDLVTTGTTVGQLAGLLSHDKKSKIDQIADALYAHAQALNPKKKVSFKAGTKQGQGLRHGPRRRLTV